MGKTYVPEGVQQVSRILGLSTLRLVYYDPDGDGGASGELASRFLDYYKKDYEIYINENRKHGLDLTPEQIKKYKGYTIILVDAGVTRAEVEYLTANGISIIVMDHHHIEEKELVYVVNEDTGCEGVIVNNQYPFEPEEYRFLSGAGVVYYTLKAIAPKVMGVEEKALVGLSLLTDVRPIDNPIAHDFLHTTYTLKTPYMQYLIDVTAPPYDFGFGVRTFDRNYIDYTFSPRINALFRLNKGYDAIRLFRGTYDNHGQLEKFREVQNRLVANIEEYLEGSEYSHLICKYVQHDIPLDYDFKLTNFIGQACSKVKNQGKTTLLCVVEDGVISRGSVRGQSEGVDYLNLFRKYGFDAEGHLNAFGIVGIKAGTLDDIDLEGLNQEIADLERTYEARKYEGRVKAVNNLAMFLNSPDVKIGTVNNYVRDSSRYLLRYVGNAYTRLKRGKSYPYIVDGIEVLSFDEEDTFDNCLILPLVERGAYMAFYMKRI